MSSLTRMLAVLDVFTPSKPMATAEEIMALLGYSRGSAYRYIRELCLAGLLNRVEAAYSLGPKIIELDFFIRECDPVLKASYTVMRELRDEVDCDVLLTSFYGNRVVVTHHERSNDRIIVTFSRGKIMPLFRGAGSKPIIAHLPPSRLKKLYAENAVEIGDAGQGRSWQEFRSAMADIRRAGYATSIEELDTGNAAIGAPIFLASAEVAGSLVLVFRKSRFHILDQKIVAEIAVTSARKIDEAIATQGRRAVLRPEESRAVVEAPPRKRKRS